MYLNLFHSHCLNQPPLGPKESYLIRIVSSLQKVCGVSETGVPGSWKGCWDSVVVTSHTALEGSFHHVGSLAQLH